MPIKVELRRGAAKPAELQVVNSRTQEPITGPTIIMSELDVREEMEKTLRAERSQLVGVSQTRMLVLRVASPTVPSLDLVDLPGLVSVKRDGEPDDMAVQTEQLLSNFIDDHKKHSVFLVVIPAAVPPNTASVLRLVQEHKIESQSIGIFTRSDSVAEKELKKVVKSRLLGEAKDGFPLRPHGWVASMNAPVEDDDGNERDDLSPIQRLELQGQEEQQWLTHRLIGKQPHPELSSRIGCNALIQKMKAAFHTYVKQTWAPFALFRLEGESARLSFEQAALGLPAAHTPLEGIRLEELQAKAIEATERVLNDCIGDRVSAAYERASEADAAAAERVEPMRGLAALSEWAAKRHTELSRATVEALRAAVIDVRDALTADVSGFKLGRFPMFVDAAMTALEDAIERTVNHKDALALVGEFSLRNLLTRAAASTPLSGWLERQSCATKRHRLDAIAAGIAPAKTSITKLLNERRPEDILTAAKLNTRHLTSCRIDEAAFARCIISEEVRFELSVDGDTQPAGKLPWTGELRASNGSGQVPVKFHAKASGLYGGSFTPTLLAFPLALCHDLKCSLRICLHGVAVPQSSVAVQIRMLTTEAKKSALWTQAGVYPESLVAAGLGADQLKGAGYSARQLKDAGFSAVELSEAGFDGGQLRAARFSATQLAGAGFDAIDGASSDEQEGRFAVGQRVLVHDFGYATIVRLGHKVKVEYDDGSTYHVHRSQLRLDVEGEDGEASDAEEESESDMGFDSSGDDMGFDLFD